MPVLLQNKIYLALFNKKNQLISNNLKIDIDITFQIGNQTHKYTQYFANFKNNMHTYKKKK